MPILRRMLTSALFIISSVIIILSLLIYIFQEKFVYYPVKPLYTTPADIKLDYEDVYIDTQDHYRLHGWYIPHPEASATVLFFHGNAGNISHRLGSIRIFHDLGLSVFIIDYRGYGNSEGKPSEIGTYHDATAAWQYLLREKSITPGKIILFGRSLGGSIASWLASHNQPGALIIESGFTSIADLGRKYYPYLPVSLINRIKYTTVDYVTKINCPILVIHSPDDEIIPFIMGQSLYKEIRGIKKFLQIEGGHNDGFLLSENKYMRGIQEFLVLSNIK